MLFCIAWHFVAANRRQRLAQHPADRLIVGPNLKKVSERDAAKVPRRYLRVDPQTGEAYEDVGWRQRDDRALKWNALDLAMRLLRVQNPEELQQRLEKTRARR